MATKEARSWSSGHSSAIPSNHKETEYEVAARAAGVNPWSYQEVAECPVMREAVKRLANTRFVPEAVLNLMRIVPRFE